MKLPLAIRVACLLGLAATGCLCNAARPDVPIALAASSADRPSGTTDSRAK